MHELSLANNIIDQVSEVASTNKVKKVISVRVLIGPLSGVGPESLEFCFSEACKETIIDGAFLVIDKSPLLINCLHCKKESEVTPHDLHCPHCQHHNVEVLSGKEFRIIDMEVI
jgi:hydrogenase nickel incorporation protein HypA/HybF